MIKNDNIRFTVEIEYECNVNLRDIVIVQASNISQLVHRVERCYIGQDGKSAVLLRIIKQEEI